MLFIDKIVYQIIINFKTKNRELYIYGIIGIFALIITLFEDGMYRGVIWFIALLYMFALWSMLLIDTFFNIKKYGASKTYSLFVFFTLGYFAFLIYKDLIDIILYIIVIGTFMFIVTIGLAYFVKRKY
ncbi:hypothetical protein [Arcobacter sp.]|uniref:hypothetical protein n=1 Tax=Arcobacter sp. TaxID=1872629 RepID=UPI003D149B58